jgi:hypothetical protein
MSQDTDGIAAAHWHDLLELLAKEHAGGQEIAREVGAAPEHVLRGSLEESLQRNSR